MALGCNNQRVRPWACLLVAAAAVVVPSASAKGPDTARICGASGCTTIQDVSTVNTLALYTSGFEPRSAPRPAPFFTVELTSSIHDPGAAGWSFLYVPSARALKIVRADFSGGVYDEPTRDSWASLSGEALAAYRRATPVMSPFPADPAWIVASTANEREVPWWIVALAIAAGAVVASWLLSRRLGARLSPRTPRPPRTTRA
jgi:hypothetical protein